MPSILTGDLDAVGRALYGDHAFDYANARDVLAQRWKVHEKVAEAYGKLNFAADSFAGSWASGNVGVRVVTTKTSSDGYRQDPGLDTFSAVTVDNDYTDILPSANVKFDFGDGKVVRLGLAKVVASSAAGRTARQPHPDHLGALHRQRRQPDPEAVQGRPVRRLGRMVLPS